MSGLKFYNRKKKVNVSIIKEIFTWIFQIAVVIFLAFVLVHFLGQRTSNIGQSMEPALNNGDKVLVNKFKYVISKPKRNDLIVFKPNGNENSHYYIKRVIGLPGEKIQIRDGNIYIDGSKLEEEFETEEIKSAGIAADEIKIGEDQYFVLGDNRNNSEDSRYADIGNVDLNYIEGEAWFILSPRSKFGFIKN